MSFNPSAYDRSSSVFVLRRDLDGELNWADKEAIAAVRQGAADLSSEPASIHSPLLGSVQDEPESAEEADQGYDARLQFAMNASLVANVLLLLAKAYAFYWSGSKAVLASAADSFVDIASQVPLPSAAAGGFCSFIFVEAWLWFPPTDEHQVAFLQKQNSLSRLDMSLLLQ